jgi:hypothetical protein
LADASFDAVIDKSLIDTLMCCKVRSTHTHTHTHTHTLHTPTRLQASKQRTMHPQPLRPCAHTYTHTHRAAQTVWAPCCRRSGGCSSPGGSISASPCTRHPRCACACARAHLCVCACVRSPLPLFQSLAAHAHAGPTSTTPPCCRCWPCLAPPSAPRGGQPRWVACPTPLGASTTTTWTAASCIPSPRASQPTSA